MIRVMDSVLSNQFPRDPHRLAYSYQDIQKNTQLPPSSENDAASIRLFAERATKRSQQRAVRTGKITLGTPSMTRRHLYRDASS